MKNLKLKIWPSKSKVGMYHAQVEEQTYREKAFGDKALGDRSYEWKASNGLRLRSMKEPEWLPTASVLFLRGRDVSEDFRVLTLTPVELILVQDAVDEYNSTFADGTRIVKVQSQKSGDMVQVNLEKGHSYNINYGDVNVQISDKGIFGSRNGRTLMAL